MKNKLLMHLNEVSKHNECLLSNMEQSEKKQCKIMFRTNVPKAQTLLKLHRNSNLMER